MKKIILISLVSIAIIISLILTFTNNKFSLEDKYYNNGKIIQISGEEYNTLIKELQGKNPCSAPKDGTGRD